MWKLQIDKVGAFLRHSVDFAVDLHRGRRLLMKVDKPRPIKTVVITDAAKAPFIATQLEVELSYVSL